VRRCLVLLALCLTLAACAKPKQESPSIQFEEPPAQSAQEQPVQSAPEEEPAPEEPEPERHPVTERSEEPLFLLSELTYDTVPVLYPGPEDTLLIETRAGTQMHLQVYDPADSALLAEGDFPGDLHVLGTLFSDGSFALTNSTQTRFAIYDKKLQLLDSLRLEPGSVLSHDRESCFLARDGKLLCRRLDSGEEQVVGISYGLPARSVLSIHPRENLLTLCLDTDPYRTATAFALLDLDKKALRYLDTRWSTMMPTREAVSFRYAGNDLDQLICPLESWGWDAAQVLNLPHEEMDAIYPVADSCEFIRIREEQGTKRLEILRLGLYLFQADLSGFDEEILWNQGLRCAGLDCDFFSCGQEDGTWTVACLNTAKLDFSAEDAVIGYADLVERGPIARYVSAQEPEPYSGEMAALRAHADEIEARYGVSLVFSGACREAFSQEVFAFTTTDSLDPAREQSLLRQALDGIERVLSRYPEDFFCQFRNESRGFFGLRIQLLGSIDSGYSVVGFEYFQDGYFNVAYDVTDPQDLQTTLHHELWHATEEKIELMDGAPVDAQTWNSLNPEDFDYLHQYEDYAATDSSWVYSGYYAQKDTYFIDLYSKTYPKEDRARIMEYAMAHPDLMRLMLVSPAIRGKLRLEAEHIRQHFDTDAWPETCLWEELLEE